MVEPLDPKKWVTAVGDTHEELGFGFNMGLNLIIYVQYATKLPTMTCDIIIYSTTPPNFLAHSWFTHIFLWGRSWSKLLLAKLLGIAQGTKIIPIPKPQLLTISNPVQWENPKVAPNRTNSRGQTMRSWVLVSVWFWPHYQSHQNGILSLGLSSLGSGDLETWKLRVRPKQTEVCRSLAKKCVFMLGDPHEELGFGLPMGLHLR